MDQARTGAGERAAEAGLCGPDDRQLDPEGSGTPKLVSRRVAAPWSRECSVTSGERTSGVQGAGQARAVQRYAPQPRSDEAPLIARVVELAGTYGRYGDRRMTAMLRLDQGWRVNHKRVERIWRHAALKVPHRQPKRGRLWLNDGSCVRLRPIHKDHMWAYDFVTAQTHHSRAFRMLVVVDEFTRECLAIDVARKLGSDDVLERLKWLMVTRGVPGNIRSDNGPEFTATVVRDWLGQVGVKTLFIEPGSPWENGYVESFNGKLRGELLNGEIFYAVKKTAVLIERWREHYNRVRPHSSQGYRPPAPQAVLAGSDAAFAEPGSAALRPALREQESWS